MVSEWVANGMRIVIRRWYASLNIIDRAYLPNRGSFYWHRLTWMATCISNYIYHNGCNYLSMLWFKLIHVSKKNDPRHKLMTEISNFKWVSGTASKRNRVSFSCFKRNTMTYFKWKTVCITSQAWDDNSVVTCASWRLKNIKVPHYGWITLTKDQ